MSIKETLKSLNNSYLKAKEFKDKRDNCITTLTNIDKNIVEAISNVNKITFDNNMELGYSIINRSLLFSIDENFLSKEYKKSYHKVSYIKQSLEDNRDIYREIAGNESINYNNKYIREIFDVYSGMELKIRKFSTYCCINIINLKTNPKEGFIYFELLKLLDKIDENTSKTSIHFKDGYLQHIENNNEFTIKESKSPFTLLEEDIIKKVNDFGIIENNLNLILEFINKVMNIANEPLPFTDVYSLSEIVFEINKTKILIFNYNRTIDVKLKTKYEIIRSLENNRKEIKELIISIKNKWWKYIPTGLYLIATIIAIIPIIVKHWNEIKMFYHFLY